MTFAIFFTFFAIFYDFVCDFFGGNRDREPGGNREPGAGSRGNPEIKAGGTDRGGAQYRLFNKLSKNPLRIPKGIPS